MQRHAGPTTTSSADIGLDPDSTGKYLAKSVKRLESVRVGVCVRVFERPPITHISC